MDGRTGRAGAIRTLPISTLFLSSILGAAGFVAVRRALLVVQVSGSSMAPTLAPGDRLLVRRGGPPERGRIVLVDKPEHWPLIPTRGPEAPPPERAAALAAAVSKQLVKRVVAVPGDVVPDRYLGVLGATAGARVPPGSLLLEGDAATSLDSRQHGYFPIRDVVGRVLCRLGTGTPDSSQET